jgi:hypothetical protein
VIVLYRSSTHGESTETVARSATPRAGRLSRKSAP